MTVKSKDLKPGDRVRWQDRDRDMVYTLDRRHDDFTGWWLTGGEWLSDRDYDCVYDVGKWTLVTADDAKPVEVAHWVIEYSQPVPDRTYSANRTCDVLCGTAERAIELFRADPTSGGAVIHVVRKVSRALDMIDWEAIPHG